MSLRSFIDEGNKVTKGEAWGIFGLACFLGLILLLMLIGAIKLLVKFPVVMGIVLLILTIIVGGGIMFVRYMTKDVETK